MARHDKAIGRYVYVTVGGVEYRVYYEEAGSGIPLLLQHTAGVDGRQWRHVLEDDDIIRDFRAIAYDLPFHGKSLPPLSQSWWQEPYRLTEAFFVEFILAFAAALRLDRPVFLGASMGGMIAADLALRRPDFFRALIACEASHEIHGLDNPFFDHPRIGSDGKAAQMYDAMGPDSPEAHKRETTWLFAQSAPPVMLGDLYYTCVEHDLRGKTDQIDGRRTPIFFLNGEYDFVMPPAAGRALADEVVGASYATMPGLGHFPMAENPAAFRHHILPILADIKRRFPSL